MFTIVVVKMFSEICGSCCMALCTATAEKNGEDLLSFDSHIIFPFRSCNAVKRNRHEMANKSSPVSMRPDLQ